MMITRYLGEDYVGYHVFRGEGAMWYWSLSNKSPQIKPILLVKLQHRGKNL